MKIPNDVKCGVCKRIFCCAECRYKHEIKTHAIEVWKPPVVSDATAQSPHNDHFIGNGKSRIYLFCPLCEQQPLALQRNMYLEMLEHVANFHLPLRCRKCTKIYADIADLKEFSKCLPHPLVHECRQQEHCCSERIGDSCEAVAVPKETTKVTISTQTSPPLQQNGVSNDTPLSVVNVRWKAIEPKVSDSVSSFKNISSINGSMRRSLDAVATKPKAPLVRTTSTPVHGEPLCIKHTERTFNASGGQVSSIYNSGAETDHSPPAAAATAGATSNVTAHSPSKQHLENVQRYLKVGGGRGKLTAATPLRQVMSKSIQKAFAEHGALPSVGVTDGEWPLRKKIFDSNSVDSSGGSHVGSPLDLRLSPVVRRTQSETCAAPTSAPTAASDADKADPGSATEQRTATPPMRCEFLLSSQKLTTESIVITRTKRLASMESAASSMNDGFSSVSSKYSEQSTNSGSSSGVSSASASSIYKTCHSVEIITSTTALSEINIQEDFYAAKGGGGKLETETMSVVTQTTNNNLPPITPITRIPGAVINKKLIRFDSPQEEAESELEKAPEPVPKVESKAALSKETQAEMKASKDADCSAADVFFTPSTTPVRKQKQRIPIKELIDAFEKGASLKQKEIKKSTIQHPFAGERVKTPKSDATVDTPDNHNDEVFLPKSTAPKKLKSKSPLTAVGRSWSFSALLGTVMRLPSMGKCSDRKNIDRDKSADVGDATADSDTANAGSLIKRCASIAGSLVRAKQTVDEERLGNLKRKRSYTAELRSSGVHQRSSSETMSPSADQSISTKRFRIQGRKPIDRMRQN